MNRVCILGGSGFVGQHLIANLAKRGIRCRVLTRHPQRHANLQINPGMELIKSQSMDADYLAGQFEGCDAVINLIGILNESGKRDTFRKIHTELVDTIVEAAIKARVGRLLHMSALHADAARGTSEYLRSKGEGENRAHTHGGTALNVTSIRPSVIFGRGDSFFNRFAALLKLSPVFFPLACPKSRFAPVWVEDVAEAFARCLTDDKTVDAHYDLCGPSVYTLQELVSFTAKTLGLRRFILPLGNGLSKMQARLLGHLPGRPFSMDNYLSLQTDSVCEGNGFEKLGIQPQAIESVVPHYLAQAGYRGRLDRYRREFTTRT
ncbi:MAG: complex I NDUFA9 subunit family protein [Candidatus Thiodiazotropha sp. (ex Myrtea spinifera)]|nr:complex I NDUFA9 subunit family protein [Candidatus Thiodiazotropha sp. (ex Myrtea spinifera)]MCU7830234.1 complex I NDUFA9 subunit family protein [Candidatus Thiodiazotropha sp. (ex Myrtea sp. 'scaly one' KF741663)]